MLRSRGRHRPRKPEPPTPAFRYQPTNLTYPLPLVETWDAMRTAYVKPRWWQRGAR